MQGIYNIFESILIWGGVALAFGVVVYLTYLQYLKIMRRRSRRRHRSHRTTRHSQGYTGENQPSHSQQT